MERQPRIPCRKVWQFFWAIARNGNGMGRRLVEVLPTFDALGLKEDLLRGVYAYGFERPSAVQQRAVQPILRGRDVIVQSQSGTGKTCVFCLGALQAVTKEREPQVLILSPTRELAEQSQKVCLALGDYANIQVHSCIGGTR